MCAMRRDHHVNFMREEKISEIALAWRQAAANENFSYFNVIEFIERVLRKRLKKGTLHIEFFEMLPGGDAAYITFDPLTLHIDKEIWDLAKIGDPDARYIIAHEIGHIILHDHFAKAFSIDPAIQLKFDVKQRSAEWQANTFAAYFLLPTHVIAAFDCVEDVVRACSVNSDLARERFAAVRETKSRSAKYEGDPCNKCGDFTLDCNGRCNTCGSAATSS